MEDKTCVLCGEDYGEFGHNAQPLGNGRCCGDCNVDVITERLRRFKEMKGDNK